MISHNKRKQFATALRGTPNAAGYMDSPIVKLGPHLTFRGETAALHSVY